MGLWTPQNYFQTLYTNFTGQANINTHGTSITVGATNVKSSYAEVFDAAVILRDCYAMEMWITSALNPAVARDMAVDIGFDHADAGSFTTKIADLLAACATPVLNGNVETCMGIHYYFPLFVKAGTQIGARASTNGSATSLSIYMRLWGDPKYPELCKAAAGVDTFGAGASSNGTTVTPSATSAEGAYADLSGADTTKSYWYWEVGAGVNDATMSNNMGWIDIGVGDGTNKHLAIRRRPWLTSGDEAVCKLPGLDGYYEAPAGVRPYGRMQLSTVADSNYSMCAYACYGDKG